MEFPECIYLYVSPTWLTQTWEACHLQCIQILGDNMDYQIPSHKDVELRVFWTGYRTTELNMLNQCRLDMQVVFVLDICNVAGTNLESYLWNKPNLAESPYLWPKIPKATPMERRLWQPALQHATSAGWNLELPLQFGKWYPKKDSSPGWYHHAQENTLLGYT